MATSSLRTGIAREDLAAAADSAPSGVPVFLGYGKARPDGATSPAFTLPYRVSRWAAFEAAFDPARVPTDAPSTSDAMLVAAVRGFFDCGGTSCWVVLLERPASGGGAAALVAAWNEALGSLASFPGFDLVCTPSLAQHPDGVVLDVQASVLRFCNQRASFVSGAGGSGVGAPPACFAVLDAIGGDGGTDGWERVDAQPRELSQRLSASGSPFVSLGGSGGGATWLRAGAIYYPWVQLAAGRQIGWVTLADGTLPYLPPCGHVAGVYSATDAKTGPYKAPANVALEGVVDLAGTRALTDGDQAQLPGINFLRTFPGRSIRVWGARTPLASLADTTQPASAADWPWLFVNVQRLFISVAAWLERAMVWTVFEPNDLSLWNRIARQVTGYLGTLYARGALAGASPAEAFFVKCDGENNPPELRALGQLVVEVGLAAIVPSEFIVVRLTQSVDGRTATEST
jgi:hypothetical protein